MKRESHRYDINITRLGHGLKYTKYKIYLSMMMLICTEQHLSNIRNLIHENVKQYWTRVEKSVANVKKCAYWKLKNKIVKRWWR